MSFNKILEKYRKLSFSERDKGDRFERLMQAYLLTEPQYSGRFSDVWMWNDFPGKGDLGGKDVGIDLVAKTTKGDYWAIQCKCFQETSSIDKKAVDSFLSTSSRTFLDENLKSVGFSHRLWISTTNKWGANALDSIRNQNPPVSRINLSNLQESPIDWNKLDEGISGESARTKKKTIREHQKDTILYNGSIIIKDIPEKAYQYIVNGRSAIEWILDRYQVKTDKNSGITNNPNDWADEVENPRYGTF